MLLNKRLHHRFLAGCITLSRIAMKLLLANILMLFACAFNYVTGSDPPLIVLATGTEIRAIAIPSGNQSLLVESQDDVMDVDYDYDEEQLFYTDDIENEISLVSNIRVKINKFLPWRREVIVNFTDRAQAIAYDWVHKVLYWIDSGKSTIELLTMKGRHRKTIVTNQYLEGGIAVDPRDDQKWVYWTNGGRIEKVGLDGSYRSLVVSGSHIGLLNDLAIDYDGNSLYFTDSQHKNIRSSDLNGQNVRVLIEGNWFRRMPYSIDVLGDMVYWDDWWSKEIYEVNKNIRSTEARTVSSFLTTPFGLRIHHATRRPKGSDPCAVNNGGCSHICLAAPAVGSRKKKFSCFCPDKGC